MIVGEEINKTEKNWNEPCCKKNKNGKRKHNTREASIEKMLAREYHIKIETKLEEIRNKWKHKKMKTQETIIKNKQRTIKMRKNDTSTEKEITNNS